MSNTFENAKNAFGSVEFEGVEYAMTNMVQADNYVTCVEVRYYAAAIDKDGNKFTVAFETLAAWDAANEKAQAEMRGNEPDLESIAKKHGVEINEFENIDLSSEEYACNWDNPVDVTPL